jgi:spore germination cell wall hydrolase CwlJ-like protein
MVSYCQELPEPPEIQSKQHVSAEMRQILGLPGPSYHYTAKDKACLVDTVYWEAGNQSNEGMLAVIDVIVNRFRGEGEFEGRYNSLCDVVLERCKRGRRLLKTYQFTGYKYHKRKKRNAERVARVTNLVDTTLNNLNDIESLTNGATYYHAVYMRRKPKWTKHMLVTCTIGQHIFYKSLDNSQ